MKILVTGGAGFIGSHLVDELISKKHKVVVIDNLSTGKKENLNPKAKFYRMDICSNKVAEVFKKEKPEILFHLAAQIDLRKSVEDPVADAKINVLGSLNLLENCKQYKVKKVIFASTGGAIYGEAKIIPTPESYIEYPLSPYGVCKLSTDRFLNYYYKVFNLPYISLRLANVYGPRQNPLGEAGVVAIFTDRMLKGKSVTIYGSGKQTRDFVFVQDVVRAMVLALKSKAVGIYNIGTAKETSVNAIFEELKDLTGYRLKEVRLLAKAGEQQRSCLSYRKAKKDLAWQAKYNLKEGLKETVMWFKLNS